MAAAETVSGVALLNYSAVAELSGCWRETLGSGSFGDVYAGQFRGERVAIKRFRARDTAADSFFRELAVAAAVQHENVLRVLGMVRRPCCAARSRSASIQCLRRIRPPARAPEPAPHARARQAVDHDQHLCLLYPRLEGGSLWDRLVSPTAPRLTARQRASVALCVARGLAAMHAARQVHHDVKSGNVLLGRGEWGAVLGDCGASHALPPGEEALHETAPTDNLCYPCWAPEFVAAGLVRPACDVYALGVLFLELLSSRPATMPARAAQGIVALLLPSLQAGRFSAVADAEVDWPEALLRSMGGLTARCLREAGELRPSAADVAAELGDACARAGISPPASPCPGGGRPPEAARTPAPPHAVAGSRDLQHALLGARGGDSSPRSESEGEEPPWPSRAAHWSSAPPAPPPARRVTRAGAKRARSPDAAAAAAAQPPSAHGGEARRRRHARSPAAGGSADALASALRSGGPACHAALNLLSALGPVPGAMDAPLLAAVMPPLVAACDGENAAAACDALAALCGPRGARCAMAQEAAGDAVPTLLRALEEGGSAAAAAGGALLALLSGPGGVVNCGRAVAGGAAHPLVRALSRAALAPLAARALCALVAAHPAFAPSVRAAGGLAAAQALLAPGQPRAAGLSGAHVAAALLPGSPVEAHNVPLGTALAAMAAAGGSEAAEAAAAALAELPCALQLRRCCDSVPGSYAALAAGMRWGRMAGARALARALEPPPPPGAVGAAAAAAAALRAAAPALLVALRAGEGEPAANAAAALEWVARHGGAAEAAALRAERALFEGVAAGGAPEASRAAAAAVLRWLGH